MKYDVRLEQEKITEIIFSEAEGLNGTSLAYSLSVHGNGPAPFVMINDEDVLVIINSKEHAFNLIKALEKAIGLGWLK